MLKGAGGMSEHWLTGSELRYIEEHAPDGDSAERLLWLDQVLEQHDRLVELVRGLLAGLPIYAAPTEEARAMLEALEDEGRALIKAQAE